MYRNVNTASHKTAHPKPTSTEAMSRSNARRLEADAVRHNSRARYSGLTRSSAELSHTVAGMKVTLIGDSAAGSLDELLELSASQEAAGLPPPRIRPPASGMRAPANQSASRYKTKTGSWPRRSTERASASDLNRCILCSRRRIT